MTNLTKRISELPDVYDDFILGVLNYAKKDPEHVKKLNEFMNNDSPITTSDVVEFIMSQPDFHNYSATLQKKVG
jgi:hypothetical protein